MQNEIPKEGRLQGLLISQLKDFFQTHVLFGFSLCWKWYQRYPKAGSPHGPMMAASSNWYSTHLCLFLVE